MIHTISVRALGDHEDLCHQFVKIIDGGPGRRATCYVAVTFFSLLFSSVFIPFYASNTTSSVHRRSNSHLHDFVQQLNYETVLYCGYLV